MIEILEVECNLEHVIKCLYEMRMAMCLFFQKIYPLKKKSNIKSVEKKKIGQE